jgi:chromosome segregation ATPase
MLMTRRWTGAAGAALLALAAGAAAQQTRDDGGGSARLQAMVQQLTGEKAQLAAANKDLTAKLDAANAELKKAREQNTALERRVSTMEATLSQSTASGTRSAEQATQLRNRMDELIAQFRETAEVLKQTELERNGLRETLATRQSALDQCVANNDKLFDTGVEILGKYEGKGCFSSLRENEPFTQNKRVQLQNLVDEYRWALEDQRLPAGARPASAAN